MHRIHFTIRRISTADLPTILDAVTETWRIATDAELLNLGLQRIDGDVFSCVEQVRRNPETQEWEPVGHAPVGELLAHGDQRYTKLPDDVKARVLRAEVIAGAEDGLSAVEIAETNLSDQAAAIAEFVGEISGGPLVDLSSPDAAAEEARRLASIPESGVVRKTIPMADVDEGVQIVEATDLIPHGWSGERVSTSRRP